ncbi:MAG: hypothetical protein C0602_11035 [Denitrovibrio sp.]|nr:MAG: hypothetical protein C0602_11035 [Denitrovibrio sp.]
MGRDKQKDDKHFNCSQEHEFQYVANLYSDYNKVYDYLKEKCKNGQIKNSTHLEVYNMIKEDLKFAIPIISFKSFIG